MKLELKHLAPYLPYGLKCKSTTILFGEEDNGVYEMGLISMRGVLKGTGKPILRPLSDLTKEEYHLKIKSWFINHAENDVKITTYDNGNYIGLTATYKMMGDVFTDIIINSGGINDTDYWLVQNLLKNHFDVFGLIEKGLAINKNTIKL
jgi:hypothetical protein